MVRIPLPPFFCPDLSLPLDKNVYPLTKCSFPLIIITAKDPDAGDPRNALQRLGRHIYTLWKGLTGNSGIFALKYALVSIALFVPAVCENSAQFYYENRYILLKNCLLRSLRKTRTRLTRKTRGLWALIMAQTGMGVFTGEQITSFVVRMVRHLQLLLLTFNVSNNDILPMRVFRVERQQVWW